jgi:PAS domain S-box-containing protein
MTASTRDTLRALLRRVDEVRGLSEPEEAMQAISPDDPEALVRALEELVEELERSHRRLIETNVQLVSLREVASRMMGASDDRETLRTVTRYLRRAFGFEHVFLLLLNRESGCLEGVWTHAASGREDCRDLSLPATGDHGSITRAMWLHRTLVHHVSRHHPPAFLPDGHALADALTTLGSTVCVPLQRSQPASPVDEPHEVCGNRCALGDTGSIAPPPGAAADQWGIAREERQRHCLACELMPVLGVIGFARDATSPPYGAADVTMLESIGLSIAPMVENARLVHDLRTSERFRNHVLDSMASALVAVDMRGHVLTFNQAAQSLLGWPEADVIGQPVGTVVGPDGEDLVRQTLDHGREALREEILLRTREGAPVPVSFTTSLLRDDRRAIYGAIATFVDLTPLKRAEEHARRQDRLAALGRFTSSVAHEIRNPLTGIGAGVQYLSRALADDAPQRENLTFILGEIRRLDRIIQDLFDITHPGQLLLRVAPLDDALRRAAQVLEPLCAERGVELRLDVAARTPPLAHDADQMQQVFINLIKNAAEASPPGSIVRVTMGLASPPAGRRRAVAPPAVSVRIEDTGSGIDAEELKRIFEPFFTTKPGGTGLGLYITHDIVKRHGGSLTVQSESGHGTTFAVELPLEHNGGPS